MDTDRMQVRYIRVKTVQHRNTNLLMAYSDDLEGLLVPGRSHEELRRRLPAAITEILQALGVKVTHVEAKDDDDKLPEVFNTAGFMARAELESCD